MMRMGDAPPAAQSEAAQPPADVAAGAHSQAAEGTHIVHDTFLQLARSLVCRSLAAAPGAGSGPQSRLAKAIFEIVILAGSSHKHDEAGMPVRRVWHRGMAARLRCARLWDLCMCRLACDVYAW